jgi:hypothetical protein
LGKIKITAQEENQRFFGGFNAIRTGGSYHLDFPKTQTEPDWCLSVKD